jgi:hypothetical protein
MYTISPFADESDVLTNQLQDVVNSVLEQVDIFDGPRFVSTPDLLDFVPNATWLPLVVDVESLTSQAPVLARRRPAVVHAPSNSALKGSVIIDPVLQSLHERGLIEYLRVEGMPHKELVGVIRHADVVVDQLLLGSYGVLACEAMAAGRVTVGHVDNRVRGRLAVDVPIIEASPSSLGEVIERVVAERNSVIGGAASGVDYARRFHDGRASARALAPFLGLEPSGEV